jgi:hypothetical protein
MLPPVQGNEHTHINDIACVQAACITFGPQHEETSSMQAAVLLMCGLVVHSDDAQAAVVSIIKVRPDMLECRHHKQAHSLHNLLLLHLAFNTHPCRLLKLLAMVHNGWWQACCGCPSISSLCSPPSTSSLPWCWLPGGLRGGLCPAIRQAGPHWPGLGKK